MDDNNLIEDEKFKEFISQNFDDTIIHATVEDLASFAFGSLEEAIIAYKARDKT